MSGKLRAMFNRARRAWAFARHVPPKQLARRLSLTGRRVLRDRIGAPLRVPPVALAADPPMPLFASRAGMIAGDAFSFLGRTHRIAGGIDGNAPKDQLWRMNLHYMEYLEEVDDVRFAALALDWISANPRSRRGAWKDSWNSYALSLRCVVWMQQLAQRNVAPSAHASIVASLAEQLAFLEQNLETDIGGNHLVKNVKALIWASAFFTGEAAQRWRRRGLRLLDEILREQILDDGMHFERSPSYHNQVFADLLECRWALSREAPVDAGADRVQATRGRPSGTHAVGAGVYRHALDAALARMAQVVADLAHPDGAIAQFNDSGLNMAYAPDACLAAYARLYGARLTPRRDFALAAAGYFGRRDGGDYWIADCGRIGPDALPAHAHGDILSFEWSLAGRRIVVDPGVYEYIEGTRRRASRSAASHNTLCFEGLDQAEFFGAFRCGRRPDVKVRTFRAEPDLCSLEGTHDGYAPARHARRFDLRPGHLRIVDRIEATAGRRATIRFLLHPEVAVEIDDQGAQLTREDTRIAMHSSVKIEREDATWSPDMGYERPTTRLRLEAGGQVEDVVTQFRWDAPGDTRGLS